MFSYCITPGAGRGILSDFAPGGRYMWSIIIIIIIILHTILIVTLNN